MTHWFKHLHLKSDKLRIYLKGESLYIKKKKGKNLIKMDKIYESIDHRKIKSFLRYMRRYLSFVKIRIRKIKTGDISLLSLKHPEVCPLPLLAGMETLSYVVNGSVSDGHS